MTVRNALFLAGLMLIATLCEARAAEFLARYSLLAHDPIDDRTVLLVRAVVDGDGAPCPALAIDGAPSTMVARDNPDAERFPITVCEAVAPLSSAVTLDGDAMPTLSGYDGGDLHVVMLGDTGCKGGTSQDCAAAWPFAGIAADAAAAAPDLVLHVGDWDYRGTPSFVTDGERAYDGCLPADRGALISAAELSDWTTWRDDVFAPAAPLFETAPWIVTRGNHELCSRAGQGWFFLLDPHSTLLDPYHATPRCDGPIVTTDPYPLHIGDLSLIVVDSSDGCDNLAWQDKAAWDTQARQLAFVLDDVEQWAAQQSGPVWLVTHRPFWAALRFEENGPFLDGDLAWQLALKASLAGRLPDNIAMAISGHVHDAQALVFDGPRPPQLIVGNGGVALDELYVERPVEAEIDGLGATGWINATIGAEHGFGYLDVTVHDAANWRARMPGFRSDGAFADVDLITCAMPMRDGMLCGPP